MEKFSVQGGTALSGTVRVSGSKNAALPIMAAALAADGPTELLNVPDLVDVRTLSQLLCTLGTEVARLSDGRLVIENSVKQTYFADYQLVRKMRASICVLGPLLARRGKACVSLPGGCQIGSRPIDLHLKGLTALGAEIQVQNGYIVARARRLRGAHVHLAGPHGSTVTGTCNLLSAAALARGTTVIDAAACEPEVVALANFLNQMGARISGQGTPQIIVDGVDQLRACQFEIIPDRIEAATLMIAAAITRGHVTLENAIPDHLSAVSEVLDQAGVCMKTGSATGTRNRNLSQSISVSTAGSLRPFELAALPYPGVPTDVQAQFMALACTIPGMSIICDRVFPDRFMHVAELTRMGADLRRQGSTVISHGAGQLTGANVMASDLRASAALVLAGLAATGETNVHRIYHLDRGYERLEQKLTQLGASVQRLTDLEEHATRTPLQDHQEFDRRRKSA